MTVCTFKPNSLIKSPCQCSTSGLESVRRNTSSLMFIQYTQPQKHQYSQGQRCLMKYTIVQCVLCDIILYGKSSHHHYHLREPVSNLTLIKTQSIAHYTISIDRRELEVSLIDESLSPSHTHGYTEPIIPPYLTISKIFSIPAG